MELTLIKKGLTTYEIINKKQQPIYKVVKKLGLFNNTIEIYDEKKNNVAIIKESNFSKIKYKIYQKGLQTDSVSPLKSTSLEQYLLLSHKWKIVGDITYTDYKVMNERNDILISMKCTLVDPDIWNIDITTDNKNFAIITCMIIYFIAKK